MFRRFVRPHCKNLKTICFSSCFSVVKVELPVASDAKFEMCVVIRFLHIEGQLIDFKSRFSVFFPFRTTSEVFQRLKMKFSPIHIQRGGGISF